MNLYRSDLFIVCKKKFFGREVYNEIFEWYRFSP